MLAGIGAMGLLGTPGCAALTEESPRDVAEEGGPRESSSPTPQKEPINAGEPFSGEIAPGMLCVAEYATNALAVVDARAGEVVGRIPVGRNPASVLVMQGIVFVGCSGTGEVTAVPVANPAAAAPIPVGHQILGLCRDEARGLIYAGDYFANGVHAIDAALQSLVSTMDLSSSGFSGRTDPPPCCTIEPGAGRRTVALALAPEGDVLYCGQLRHLRRGSRRPCDGRGARGLRRRGGPAPDPRVRRWRRSCILAGVGGEGEQQVSDAVRARPRHGQARAGGARGAQSVAGVALAADGAAGVGHRPRRRRARGLRRGRLERRRGGSHWAWASTRWCSAPDGETLLWWATASAARCTPWTRRRWRCCTTDGRIGGVPRASPSSL